jgi:hypothetical protein
MNLAVEGARQLVQMALREFAVVDHLDDVVADLGDDVDGLPQPLAAVGVAGG